VLFNHYEKRELKVKKKIPLLLAVLVGILSFAMFVSNVQRKHYVADLKRLSMISENITRQLSDAFAYAKVMEMLIRRNENTISQRRFVELTDLAMHNSPCIDSFMLAPNAVVTYIYPIGINSPAIGHDLLHDPNRRQATLEAIEADDVIAQGPVDAIQGGIKVFGRKAMTVKGEFWGLAIINVDFERLLETSGIFDKENPFDFVVVSYKPNGDRSYVYGAEKLIDAHDVSTIVSLNNLNWKISTRRPVTAASLLTDYGIYLLLSIIFGVLVYYLELYYLRRLQMSRTDMLTKTMNRAEFKRQVSRRMRQSGSKFALLVIDLDRFKEINDNYGHLAGDKVLVHIAKQISKVIRGTDMVSRLGGDEYMVFLDGMEDEVMLQSTVARIREMASQRLLYENNSLGVGISVGYALYPRDGKEFDHLYRLADERMYQEKVLHRG
jgi:diguanylate cyclase (GGDEF)-like protein